MPRWLKVILLVALIAIVVVVLFTTVFPWVEARLDNPAIGVVQVLRPPR